MVPWFPGAVSAQDGETEGRPEMMREPTAFVNVIDSFDEEDLFDLHIGVGFQRTWEIGRVQRQADAAAPDPRPGMNGHSNYWNDIANYERGLNLLNLSLEVGVFRDLALYARLPVILSDDRVLSRAGGDPSAFLATPDGVPLFDLPAGGLRSPTRSGIDSITVGAAWSILNQERDPNVATWMILLEGRFNLGEPMRACAAGLPCNDRDFTSTGMAAPASLGPGVGRGMNALRAETRTSWRYEVIEPYAGLAFQMEWPGYNSSTFLPQGDLQGYINEQPPIFGRFTLGVAIVPWEDREAFQRLTIDVRFTGDYLSEGHDYSPLFDALGTSTNLHLAALNRETECPPDGPCDGNIPFYGLTDTQSRGRFGANLFVEMVAARYVRFSAYGGFTYSPSYVITQADACNPNVSGVSDTDPRRGTCVSGIINPHHRPSIDLPGQRFRMDDVWTVDIGVTATATF
jgi:hypothetical protein